MSQLIQKSLFQNDGKTIAFIESVHINLIEISEYNPRKTWDEKHVFRLAQLIEDNGYDTAFAIKCHKKDDGLRCFAGSNRLKAARKAGKQFIPVFLYEGYEDSEIWRMAYEDNEQADAQQQFSIVDVWLDYKEKSEAGMTQQQIADSLGVSRETVKFRLKFASFPDKVIHKIGTSGLIKEGHCRELDTMVHCTIFPHETLLCEIIDNVTNRANEPTSKQFKKEVEKYNAAINAAKESAEKLEGEWFDLFIEKIKDDRNAASIERQGTIFLQRQQDAAKDELQKQISALNKEEEELLRIDRELEKANKIKEVTDRIICGDSIQKSKYAPHGIKLIFTDPPYGANFQSNRRVSSSKSEKIKNDDDIKTAIETTKSVLSALYNKVDDNSSLLLWCDWKSEFDFRELITELGWEIKNSLIWIRPNHGTGDLAGTFAPKHDRLLFATKGRVILNKRIPDVFHGGTFLNTSHPTPKPIDAISNLIECLTLEGDLIVDPFMGSGSTGVSAIRNNRIFWGCEIGEGYWGESMTNIKNELI